MQGRLKRELGLVGVFAMAAGAMISSGLFVLPTLVYADVGPAAFVSYMVAALILLPSLLSKAELMTAMPKAGGTFFHVDRSMGPAFGMVGGVANWASLAFKCAFALIGLGTFAAFAMPAGDALTAWEIKGVACLTGLLFTVLNLLGTKHAGRAQGIMVGAMLAVIIGYVGWGATAVDLRNFGVGRGSEVEFLPYGFNSLLIGAGMVFISFGGLTQVANLAEEVKNPRRDLVWGMFAAYILVSLLYGAAVLVTVGVRTPNIEWGYAPLSMAALRFAGTGGFIVMSAAALFAYMTTGNAGILTASRTLMAMAQDGLVPARFARVTRNGTPRNAVLFTSAFMLVSIVALPLALFVKAASAMLILLLMFEIMALIVMRESRVPGYQPSWLSPGYPWLHVAGLLAYFFLLVELGSMPLAVAVFVLGVALAWYTRYVKIRVLRQSALVHLAGRLAAVDFDSHDVDTELARIVRERDAIVESRFSRLLTECDVVDVEERIGRDALFTKISENLAPRANLSVPQLSTAIERRESLGSTVMRPGLAMPHAIMDEAAGLHMLALRCRPGVDYCEDEPPVHAVFAIAAGPGDRDFYLEYLVDLAEITQQPDFDARWNDARDVEALRDILLQLDLRRRRVSVLSPGDATE